ncbi:MAG TPA: isoprenylcysteine carboxylmethyltransferase family protein [Terriglobales bacterium]|nr:isoprenylcysteine carboxylmethyltransferase family protein [Terriglobales bacterium]
MTNQAPLHILGYVWTFFGAYWMSFSVLKYEPGAIDRRARRWKFAFLAVTFVALFAGRNVIPPAVIIVLAIVWTALGLYWGAPGKGPQSGEFKWYRPLRLVILAVVFALLFWNATAVGLLGKHFVREIPVLGWIGFVAAILGMFVTSWSRIALGRYWSDKVIVQAEHQLIRTGPYSCMRHPLYSGVLLAVLGTALVVGEVRGLVSFAVLLVNYMIKAKREERILAERFGAEFKTHVARTGFLLPRFRHL